MIRTASTFAVLIVMLASVVHGQEAAEHTRTVYVTVGNSKTDFVGGLKAENFTIFDNKAEQRVISFSDQPEPMSIGFLFDVSGSIMSGFAFAKDVNDVASDIYESVKAGGSGNEYCLMGFNQQTHLLTDWTSSADSIASGLRQLATIQNRKSGNTAFYDAIFVATHKLNTGQHRKKVLIMFTDGQDNSSSRTRDAVIREILANDILIYTIRIAPDVNEGTILPADADSVLTDLADDTGGLVLTVQSLSPNNPNRKASKGGKSETKLAFERIFDGLASQYALSYAQPRASEMHRIEVKLELNQDTATKHGKFSLWFRKRSRSV